MPTLQRIGEFHNSHAALELAPEQPEELRPLMDHLIQNISAKTEALKAEGRFVNVLGPDWCRDNPQLAGELHARLIVKAYGDTYALPNKDPIANQKAIESGDLDVYLLQVDRDVVATACLVDTHDGRGELGRAASIGNAGGSIILDLRILDWLTNPQTANRYHTLFTTLRTAPDRVIENGAIMRGGQAITSHWRKFPGAKVNGVGPFYFKHGALEQFTLASLSRSELRPDQPLFVSHPDDAGLIQDWHKNYNLPQPPINPPGQGQRAEPTMFEAHYPPAESGITELVHADVVESNSSTAKPLEACLVEADKAGSPFTQVVVPIDRDTTALQSGLRRNGFRVFGYIQADEHTSPALLFGMVKPGRIVVPTDWDHQGQPNPFWQHPQLKARAEAIAKQWQ